MKTIRPSPGNSPGSNASLVSPSRASLMVVPLYTSAAFSGLGATSRLAKLPKFT
jgi:hypothetical protein